MDEVLDILNKFSTAYDQLVGGVLLGTLERTALGVFQRVNSVNGVNIYFVELFLQMIGELT